MVTINVSLHLETVENIYEVIASSIHRWQIFSVVHCRLILIEYIKTHELFDTTTTKMTTYITFERDFANISTRQYISRCFLAVSDPMFSLDAKEFLLGGPLNSRPNDNGSTPSDGTVSMSALKEIGSYSQYLISESQTFLNEETTIAESFDAILTKVSAYRSQIDDPDLLVKIQHNSSIQSQIQLLTLAKALNDLQKFSNVRDIPQLVQNLMSTLPKHLQSSCKIHKNIITTVTNMKTYLLKKFHEDFNAHLESNEDSNDAKQMWSDFLIVARDWLVAYALVSLLPILISDSRSQILEKYTEALDEALTPLWGRFHFHLKSARESKSFEQFVWTFSYAKNFVSLLINLSTQLTSTGLLEKLDPGDDFFYFTYNVLIRQWNCVLMKLSSLSL